MAESSTQTIELHDVRGPKLFEAAADAGPDPPGSLGHRLGGKDDGGTVGIVDGPEGSLPSPTTAAPVVEKWNYPKSNTYRIGATFFSFLVMGANDAAYGVSLPTSCHGACSLLTK